ncbi:unnamed protein product [Mycena citricolor]|uniref:Uncharacterized protein n=1 Tax=Mycena citricolor TaxID=2018698 RepID=A0AAD2HU66_9AGAR|nr:unnamed protein product [Mycena citricolor]CAK5282238.1 unnamed protein product [Mycena citricolor]
MKGLPAATAHRASLAGYLAELARKFPGVKGIERTPRQYEVELCKMRITTEELAQEKLKVGALAIHTRDHIANRIEDQASGTIGCASPTPGSTVSAPPTAPIPDGGDYVPTTEELAQLRTILEQVIRAAQPDTPEGRATYAGQVAKWQSDNRATQAAGMLRIESTGFPLEPGAVIPGSGECWRCAMSAHAVESAKVWSLTKNANSKQSVIDGFVLDEARCWSLRRLP